MCNVTASYYFGKVIITTEPAGMLLVLSNNWILKSVNWLESKFVHDIADDVKENKEMNRIMNKKYLGKEEEF